LRYAPVVGSHVPSPLGRLLRLPVVPVALAADPPFAMVHPEDACGAMVAAMEHRADGPLNVVGPGAVSPWQVGAAVTGGCLLAPMLSTQVSNTSWPLGSAR